MDVTNGHLDCWTIFWTIFLYQFKEGAIDYFSLSVGEGRVVIITIFLGRVRNVALGEGGLKWG